jgi:hypothetical protein
MRNAQIERTARAIAAHDFSACDPMGVAESYRKGEQARTVIAKLVGGLCGLEHAYFEDALRVLDCRLRGQYAYVRDTIGLDPLFAPTSEKGTKAMTDRAVRFVPVNDPRPGQKLYCASHGRMESADQLFADLEHTGAFACDPPLEMRGFVQEDAR